MGDSTVRNLFDAGASEQMKARLARLTPQSERQWGAMTAAQMVAHCVVAMQWAVGEVVPDRMPLLPRVMGRLVKPLVFCNDAPIRKNAPSARSLRVTGAPDLNEERERLARLIDKFVAGGPEGCTKHPHSFFGTLTPEQWAIMAYKHLDHHLRQFGV